MRNHITALAVAGAATAVLLAGCGAGSSSAKVASLSSPKPTVTTAPAPGGGNTNQADDMDQMRAYAKCMRDNGYDMPDPAGSGDMPGVKPDDPKFAAANEKCASKMPNGGQPTSQDPAELDKMREWAKCMRDHGVDIPDPQPGEGLPLPDGADPKVQAGTKVCGSVGG